MLNSDALENMEMDWSSTEGQPQETKITASEHKETYKDFPKDTWQKNMEPEHNHWNKLNIQPDTPQYQEKIHMPPSNKSDSSIFPRALHENTWRKNSPTNISEENSKNYFPNKKCIERSFKLPKATATVTPTIECNANILTPTPTKPKNTNPKDTVPKRTQKT